MTLAQIAQQMQQLVNAETAVVAIAANGSFLSNNLSIRRLVSPIIILFWGAQIREWHPENA